MLQLEGELTFVLLILQGCPHGLYVGWLSHMLYLVLGMDDHHRNRRHLRRLGLSCRYNFISNSLGCRRFHLGDGGYVVLTPAGHAQHSRTDHGHDEAQQDHGQGEHAEPVGYTVLHDLGIVGGHGNGDAHESRTHPTDDPTDCGQVTGLAYAHGSSGGCGIRLILGTPIWSRRVGLMSPSFALSMMRV